VNGFEDWALWIDIMSRGYDVAVLDEPLFHYRVKEHSMFTDICKNYDALRNQLRTLYHHAYAACPPASQISGPLPAGDRR
jgi:hypothetical protein